MAHGGHHEDADGPYEEEWFQTLDRVVHERMAACFDDFKAELRADTQGGWYF
jgi:neutral trehalase